MVFLVLLSVFGLAQANKKQCLADTISEVKDVCTLHSQLETCKADLERVQATPMVITRDDKSAQLFATSANSAAYNDLLSFTRMVFNDAEDAPMYFIANLKTASSDELKGLFPMRVDSNDELGAVIALQRVVGGIPTLHSVLTGTQQPTSAPTYLETAFLDVTRQTFLGNIDQRDSGLLTGRSMKFVKKADETLMKLTYADNLRVLNHGKVCIWRILVDGKGCAPYSIENAKYAINSSNDHENHAISGTCAGLKAGEHTITVDVRNEGGADCYTGWDANSGKDAFFLEAAELNPETRGNGMITTKMFPQKHDGADSGVLAGRSMAFEKMNDASELRVTWQSNIRAYSTTASVGCYWELMIDGKSCTAPSKVFVGVHTNKNDNDHHPVEMVGWCKGIAAGAHTLTVQLTQREAAADCYTGWKTSDYMEVWEPTVEERAMISYKQEYNKVNGDDARVGVRTMTFTKKSSTSNVRIVYFDNFRVIGANKWCRWEVKVDGWSCKVPLANSVHTQTGDNDHQPSTVIGECPGLGKGQHTVSVDLTNGGGADCYTGWMTTNLIEIQEEEEKIEAPAMEASAFLDVTRQTFEGNIDARDNGALNGRSLKFVKKEAGTLMKLTYADNLRVYHNAHTCIWRILVDGKNCAMPIENAKYTISTGNDHENHAIVGSCPDLAAGEHTMTVDVRNENNADCYTGWDPVGGKDAFFMEAAELNPKGMITTKMFPQKHDGADSGVLGGRTMDFTKVDGSTDVRITWASNIRAYSTKQTVACYWEIMVDGQSCANPSRIHVAVHTNKNDNDHFPVEVVGWCKGIAAGAHTLTVQLTQRESAADCYTGWKTSDYMEVWEPSPQESPLITYMQKAHGQANGDDIKVGVHTMKFTKKSDSTNVRILYFDNFRVIEKNGKWCRWEVMVDGNSCPVKLANSVHTNAGENDHHPGTILGECAGLKAGEHTISVNLQNTGNADCYTSWMTHTLIEVQEEAA